MKDDYNTPIMTVTGNEDALNNLDGMTKDEGFKSL
jgi:hypothetical protein